MENLLLESDSSDFVSNYLSAWTTVQNWWGEARCKRETASFLISSSIYKERNIIISLTPCPLNYYNYK